MTTTVIVQAHCAKDKEVFIKIEQKHAEGTVHSEENVTIQDGETWSGVVYDSKAVTVGERVKS